MWWAKFEQFPGIGDVNGLGCQKGGPGSPVHADWLFQARPLLQQYEIQRLNFSVVLT